MEATSQTATGRANWVTEHADYPFTIGASDWEEYAEYRMPLSPTMIASWLQHHKNHGGKFDVAHDIGAGSGAGAAAIAPSFSHVYVSDPGEGNIATAKANLQPASKFTFGNHPAEVAWPPEPSSVDFACFCNSLHWTETDTALRNVAASLRPGGTVAAAVIAIRINFQNDEALTKLWVAATTAVLDKLLDDGLLPLQVQAGMRKAIRGYDNIAFPAELFTDVRRVNINTLEGDLEPYRFADTAKFEPFPSRIAEGEKVEYARDADWSREVDAAWLRSHMRTSSLPMDDDIWALPAWVAFEKALAEKKDPTIAQWAVSMVMATRK